MDNLIESVYTWKIDALVIFLRYFVLAGIAYVIFYKWKSIALAPLKIQDQYPAAGIITSEIVNSVVTLIIFCATSWLIFLLEKSDHTRIYRNIHDHSYGYFIGSIIIMIFIHDAYFYWTHRFMHLRSIYRWVHATHHHSHNPTPWASFSFHPVEAIVAAGVVPLITLTLPCHPYALFVFLTFMTFINVMGHLGYETFPETFTKNKIGKWQNSSTNHNIHHQTANHNFGLYFTFWDRLMNTFQGRIG
jgi:sterol desaturase/sphingolipid hydroxylase (fatty acid hydroxylase superfamily)